MTREEFEKGLDDEHSSHSFPDSTTEDVWTQGFYDGADFAWPIIERLERENKVLRDGLKFYKKEPRIKIENFNEVNSFPAAEALENADRIRKGEA